MTIKFIGNEIGNITAYKGFETSFEFMTAVKDKCFFTREEDSEDMFWNVCVGDYLFDYETGTMWKVVE